MSPRPSGNLLKRINRDFGLLLATFREPLATWRDIVRFRLFCRYYSEESESEVAKCFLVVIPVTCLLDIVKVQLSLVSYTYVDFSCDSNISLDIYPATVVLFLFVITF